MLKIFGKLYGRLRIKETKSIRFKLITNYSLLISILVIVIGTANIIITTNIIMNNISYYVQQTVNETHDKIDVALKNVESSSRLIITNPKIQQAVINAKMVSSVDLLESYTAREKLSASLNDVVSAMTNIHSTGIYLNNNRVYYFGRIGDKSIYNMLPIESMFSLLDNPIRNLIWIPPHMLQDNAQVFSLVRNIVDLSKFNSIGSLVLNIEVRYLSNILNERQLGESGSIILMDSNGVVISGKDMPFIRKTMPHLFLNNVITQNEGTFVTNINGIPMLIAYDSSDYTGWKMFGMVPLSELNKDIATNQATLVFIGFIGLVISLILSIYFASKITAPISNLMAAMIKVEKGNLDVAFEDNNFRETKELGEGFQMMQKNLRDLISKLYEGELRKKEAEYKALQAQINPHFLYNTLETINYMLLIDERYEESKLVTYLGDLLRYSIKKGEDSVSLEEDIEQIEKYLYIQKARFGDRLSYELFIDSSTRNCQILKFLIQPLVENSIIHGIEAKRGNGIVKISSTLLDNCLHILVEDNGIGMSEEQLDKILIEDTAHVVDRRNTKLGVNNVNRRIMKYYGDNYGLKVSSKINNGTKIVIVLPHTFGGEQI